jgi:PhzF family phenazine biosynthesis protein
MEILRYAAFGAGPNGGNPAGVVLDATDLDERAMQAVAAQVGFSETAFIVGRDPDGGVRVRYFAPLTEVPFCGHATIALAVAYADQNEPGNMVLRTQAGSVPVRTVRTADDVTTATLTSVSPSIAELGGEELTALLSALGWTSSELDPTLPPRVASAGASHPIVAAATRERLANLAYDFPALRDLMVRCGWTTIDLVWRESPTVFHVRNPFPPGGVVEDPATGAAAAALGGYLRALDLVTPPTEITVYQGADMGCPSVIGVTIPAALDSGISVTGTAVLM